MRKELKKVIWFGADIMAGFKDIFGGGVSQYEKLMHDATDEAFRKLVEEGGKVGAAAVIGINFFLLSRRTEKHRRSCCIQNSSEAETLEK